MGAFDIIHNNELGILGFAVPSAKCYCMIDDRMII